MAGYGVMTEAWRRQLEAATQHIAAHDQRLAALIVHYGACRIVPHTNYYQELVDAIISQQLSVKAAGSIERKFQALFGGKFPPPEEILAKDTEALRSAGLSRAKAAYIQDLAQRIVGGKLLIGRLAALSNDEIVRELVAVKGIGEWTAHMFLIFSLGRLDVLPVGDLGIRNGVQKLYELAAAPGPAEIKDIASVNHWHPYESVASWYIWQSLDNAPSL